MDKYQKKILYNDNLKEKESNFSFFSRKDSGIPACFACKEQKSGNKWSVAFDPRKDELIIVQNADISSTVYFLFIEHTAIESISSRINGAWIDAQKESDSFKIALDFDNKATEIKLSFKYGIADDYIFRVIYKDADKELYFKRQEEKKKKEQEDCRRALDQKVNIEAHAGNMLVNIHFNLCSSDCERTVIELYRANRPMAIYEVEKAAFFKSITGLAYGDYTFVLKQYNKYNKLIYDSKPKSFRIKEPISDSYFPGDVN